MGAPVWSGGLSQEGRRYQVCKYLPIRRVHLVISPQSAEQCWCHKGLAEWVSRDRDLQRAADAAIGESSPLAQASFRSFRSAVDRNGRQTGSPVIMIVMIVISTNQEKQTPNPIGSRRAASLSSTLGPQIFTARIHDLGAATSCLRTDRGWDWVVGGNWNCVYIAMI